MKILSDFARKAFCYGSLGIAVPLALHTLFTTLNPPSNVPVSVLNQVQDAISNNERAHFDPVTKGYLNGILLKTTLIIVLCGVSYYTADNQPKTLEPDAAKPAPSQEAVTDEQHESIVEAFRREVAMMIKEMPWLLSLLQTDIVIIAGEPGTGKSSVAQSLALLRLILFATATDIVDPDLDNNLLRQTWVTGSAYGAKADGPFPEQLASYFKDLVEREYPDSQGHTVILDEISKWTTSLKVNSKEAEGYLRHLYTTFRRKNIWSIMLLHGMQQDYNLQGCSAGTLTNLYPYAGVIRIEAAKNPLGKTKFSSIAKFKPPGKPMTEDNWEDILIRPSFHASNIVKMLGKGAEYFGIGIETPGSGRQAQAMAQAIDLLEEAVPTHKDFAERLEVLFQQQIQPAAILAEEELTVETARLDPAHFDLINRFYQYLTVKTASVKPGDDGLYLVRDIWRNWGNKQSLWPSVGDFKTWLKQLETANIGLIKIHGQSWRWRFMKGFKGVK